MILEPRNYVKPEVAPKNREAIIAANKDAEVARITDYVGERPRAYGEIIAALVDTSPLTKHELYDLIVELDKVWHPKKFETQVVPKVK